MTTTGKIVLAAAAVLALSASPVSAGDWEDGHHEKAKKIMDEVTKELGLSAEQLSRIEEERSRCWTEKKDIVSEIKDRKKSLKGELRKETVDGARVDSLVGEITELYGRKLRLHVDSLMKVRSILTPEQFAAFQEKMDSRKGEWKEELRAKSEG